MENFKVLKIQGYTRVVMGFNYYLVAFEANLTTFANGCIAFVGSGSGINGTF